MGILLPRLLVVSSIVGSVLRLDAHTANFEFNDPAQFTDHFAVTYIQAGSPTGTVSVSSDTLIHNASGGSTAAWVYDATPHNTAATHLFGDFTLNLDFVLNTTNASLGVFFGGRSRTDAALALVNLSNSKPGEQLRLMIGASMNGAHAGSVRHALPPGLTSYLPNRTYRLTVNVAYVSDNSAQITLTVSDPYAIGTPLPPLVLSGVLDHLAPLGEIGIRSYTGAAGSNTFDNLTIINAIPDPSTYGSL